MIPGGAGMQSARDIDLAMGPADWVLSHAPHLEAPVTAFLDLCADVDSLDALQHVALADPDGFDSLSVLVANAYFADDVVRAAIGYPGQEARDSSVGLTDEDLALVEQVRVRGPIYRTP